MSEYDTSYVNAAYGGTLRQYIMKVFTTMGIGLAVTAAVAFFGYMSLVSGGIFYKLFTGSSMIIWILMIAQIGLCIALSAGINRMSTAAVTALFYGYAAITGVTFSFLPLAWGASTVFTAFLFAAVMFISCVVIGHFTSVDLSRFSGLAMGALVALIIMSILSMFIPALYNSLIYGYVGVAIFLFLTAWDMQKIKSFYYQTEGAGNAIRGNLAVYSAFQLYLDFINLFLYVLRILGSRSSRD